MRKVILFLILSCSFSAFAQTGKCHSVTNNGATCSNDSDCTGGAAPYCAVVKHVFIIGLGNHSYDNYFGTFTSPGGCAPGSCDAATTTASCNIPDGNGCTTGTYTLIPADPTIAGLDCNHTHVAVKQQYNGGAMNRFNICAQTPNGWGSQYNGTTLPSYWTFATNYGLADRMFTTVLDGVNPNLLYMISGQAARETDVFGTTVGATQCQLNPSTSCFVDSSCPTGDHCSNGNGCTALRKGLCSGDNLTRCSVTSDCSGVGGSCIVDQANGHCILNPGTSCTLDSTCNALTTGDTCSNQNLFTGHNQGVSTSGTAFSTGVCTANDQVSCSSIDASNCAGFSPSTCSTANTVSGGIASSCQNQQTIFDLMDTASVSWAMYADLNANSQNFRIPLTYIQHLRFGSDWANLVRLNCASCTPTTADEFTTAVCAPGFVSGVTSCTNCTSDASCSTVPSVNYLMSTHYTEDGNTIIQQGEQWTTNHIFAIMANPYLWKHSVIFVEWNNAGGYYDHVAPPTVDAATYSLGMRVPLLCIGAYCKNRITTTTYQMESLMTCIEHNWSTGNLGLADATANNPCDSSAGSMMDLTLANPVLGGPVIGASRLNKNTKLGQGTSIQ